ncbi:MAG TPA: TetR/AcrR family transcriptional regulator [Actinomycetes bacterium]|nr:TetR/AcrR family transcriptional regulator [Actinomycetes bacterium]
MATRTRQGRRVNAANALRREARRLEFLEAAIEVIRSEGPGASMDQVAAKIGVTKPVVYRYFGDRGGMYRAVAERYCGELRNKFRGAMSTTADLRAVVVVAVDAYLELVERDPQVHRFLVQPQPPGRGGDAPAVTPFTWHVAAEIVDALRLRLEAAALDPDVAEPWGHGLVGMVQAAAGWWVDHRTMPRTRLVEHLVTLLWVGLGNATDAIDLVEARPVEAPVVAANAKRQRPRRAQ